MYNYVRARMGDADVAEDVVAEAYLRAARSFGSFDPGRAKFSTWVVRIASNCMNDHWRRTRPTASIEDAPEAALARPGGQERLDDLDLVDRLLGALEGEERDLVLMKYLLGYRNVDIAAELGMNPSTVSSRLARALEKMRDAAPGATHGNEKL